jgi:lipopolysaccharide transport system permease protein
MHKVFINARKKGLSVNWREIVEYRDLLFTLARRDLKVRYAQTALGFIWAVFQPLTTLIIFTLVFSRVAKISTGPIPYPVFAISGLALWNYFSMVLGQAGNSIVGAQGMISKIYFPRLIIPVSKALVGLVDLGINLVFLAGIMLVFGILPSPNIVWVPVFLLLTLLAGLSVGIWFSALIVRFRDLQQIVPLVLQLGMYLTPVAYPASKVPAQYQWIYFLNPMAGIIEGFRWSLLGGTVPGPMNLLSIGLVLLTLVSGLYYFRSVERVMADIV